MAKCSTFGIELAEALRAPGHGKRKLGKIATIAFDMKNPVRLAFVLILSFASGCNPSPNPEMTGTWLFALTPTGSTSEVIQATANFTQLDNQLTGQVALTANGAACGNASVTGTVKGNALAIQIAQEQSIVDFTGTANQAFTSASGTYSTTTWPCFAGGSTGSWTATLQ